MSPYYTSLNKYTIRKVNRSDFETYIDNPLCKDTKLTAKLTAQQLLDRYKKFLKESGKLDPDKIFSVKREALKDKRDEWVDLDIPPISIMIPSDETDKDNSKIVPKKK